MPADRPRLHMGQSTRVDSIDELAKVLPEPAGWTLTVTRWMKIQL